MQTIIGRDEELRRIGEVLDAIDAGPVALVIEGEIGIGKTALWSEGLAAAGNRFQRALACRPIDSEAQLAYAALGDLLAEVPQAALAEPASSNCSGRVAFSSSRSPTPRRRSARSAGSRRW